MGTSSPTEERLHAGLRRQAVAVRPGESAKAADGLAQVLAAASETVAETLGTGYRGLFERRRDGERTTVTVTPPATGERDA